MVGESENLSQIQNQILASANDARASYTNMAASIAKMGTLAGKAFPDTMGNIDTDEIIKFTELMNKNFVVGGSSATEQASAMYQLTQAMAAGKLQGCLLYTSKPFFQKNRLLKARHLHSTGICLRLLLMTEKK